MGIENTRGVKADVGYARVATLGNLYGILGNPALSVEDQLAIDRLDRGILKHDADNRPRPYPYDPRVNLTVTADAAADTFGNYSALIPVTTYDFGDSPNYLQVEQLVVESISADDVYVLEFYSYDGDVTYAPLGAVRFVRAAVFPRSWIRDLPCRCFNIDEYSLQARLKSAGGGNNVIVSLSVRRHLHTDSHVGPSPGVWPFG